MPNKNKARYAEYSVNNIIAVQDKSELSKIINKKVSHLIKKELLRESYVW